MEDFIFKKKRVCKKNTNAGTHAVYYYIKHCGFERFDSETSAAKRYGLNPNSVSGSAIKSSKQTIDEFLSDKAVNKFLFADDPKADELIKMYGLM